MTRFSDWRRLRKNLLAFDFFLCLFLIFCNIIFYYFYTRSSYNEMLQLSHNSTIAQVAKSYETLVGNAETAVATAAFRDGAVHQAADNAANGVTGRIGVIKALENIMLQSDFLQSVTLYLKDTGLTYTAGKLSNRIVPLEAFHDADVLREGLDDNLRRIAPRQDSASGAHVVTLTARVYAGDRQYGVLAGNIDMDAICRYVIDRELTLEGTNEIYILDKADSVLYPYGGTYQPDTHRYIVAEARSDTLGWRFILQGMRPRFHFWNRNAGLFLLASISLLGVSLVVTLVVVGRSTRPMKRIMDGYAHNFWNRLLTGDMPLDEDALDEMRRQDFNLARCAYAVLAVQGASPAELPGTRVVRMRRDLCAVICKNADGESLDALCTQLLDAAPEGWVGRSGIKTSAASLQSAYYEAAEALKYKFCGGGRVLAWERVESATPFQYDQSMETKLVNYVITGDTKGGLDFLEQLFAQIAAGRVEDNRVFSIVYQLQNAILRGVAFLSVRFPAEGELPVERIRPEMERFVREACAEVNRQNPAEQYSVFEQILFEVEHSFTNPDFCLDYLADSLDMNKAFLSKCIKENTGDSFPEFINKKRVELAKLLLLDTDETIESISGQAGFSYSYYFIRIFKRYEGITPKQYRDSRGAGK